MKTLLLILLLCSQVMAEKLKVNTTYSFINDEGTTDYIRIGTLDKNYISGCVAGNISLKEKPSEFYYIFKDTPSLELGDEFRHWKMKGMQKNDIYDENVNKEYYLWIPLFEEVKNLERCKKCNRIIIDKYREGHIKEFKLDSYIWEVGHNQKECPIHKEDYK